MTRIGLFGGSFDPVHWGHLLVAQTAVEELGLDRLYFIPAFQSPFKPACQPGPAGLRLKLLRLALAGYCRYEIDDQEIRRARTTYSIETARDYAARFPGAQRYYLIGADHVEQLPQWREAEALAALVEFAVIPRPGEPVSPLPQPFRWQVLSGFPLGLSSSQVRARVRAGRSIETLTPGAVAEAIRHYRLYQQP